MENRIDRFNEMEVPGRTQSNSKYDEGDIFCQPCQVDGDNLQADGFCETCNEYFCSSCLKVHRKQSATRNHVIKGKDEMPRVKVQTDPCSELCEVHKTEVVKFFCEGHNSVGCGDCMVLEHKTCKVQLVSDRSGNYDNSDELKEIMQKIEELEQKVNASKVERKKSLKAAYEVKAEVIREIKTFRKEMDTYLDKVESELIQEVEQLNAKDVSQQRQFFDECFSMENELHEFQTKLDRNSDKINQLFVTAKQVRTKLYSCQQSVEKITSYSQIHVYKFDPCENIKTLKLKSIPFGKIATEIKKINVKTKTDIVNMKMNYVKKINVKATNESENCWITGLAMLSSDEILLADSYNKCLKVLNVKSKTIASCITLADPPWDVTLIDTETVATTLPEQGKIMFVSTLNILSKNHSLKVREGCRGIDHRNGVIAVSYDDPPAVQMLNMEGDILHEVKDTDIFKEPWYIAFRDDNSIVLSDGGSHAVYKLTIDGNRKATMKGEELTFPRGLAVTSNDTVVVCSQDNSESVGIIVPRTNEIKQLSVQHVESPFTILVCEEYSTMYICECRGSVDDNFIKVYNMMLFE